MRPSSSSPTFRRTFGDAAAGRAADLRASGSRRAADCRRAGAARGLCGEHPRALVNWAFPWTISARSCWPARDAYVSTRRGGGWDPLAAEALACGKALVATDFGSQRDLVRAHGFAVAAGRADDPRQPGSCWAEPDPDSFAAQLRQTFERRAEHAAAPTRADAFAAAHDIERSADRLVRTPRRARRLRAGAAATGAASSGGARTCSPAASSSCSACTARAPPAWPVCSRAWASGPGAEDDLLIGPDNPQGPLRIRPPARRLPASAGRGRWRLEAPAQCRARRRGRCVPARGRRLAG